MFFAFLIYTRFDLEYLTVNKKHQVIQTHHFILALFFEIMVFVLLPYIFLCVMNRLNRYVLKSNISIRAS